MPWRRVSGRGSRPERHDQRPSRCDLGQLDRGFDCLRTAVGQEDAGRLIERAREVARQSVVELQTRLVIDDVLLAVDQLRCLLGYRRTTADARGRC